MFSTIMFKYASVAVCLLAVNAISAGEASEHPKSLQVSVTESAVPGYKLGNIPQLFRDLQVPAPGKLSISSGNEDDRFVLKSDTGDLCVKRYLNYEIHSRYTLTLVNNDSQVIVLVTVIVQDDPNYPPVFNPACYMPPRTKNITDEWPFTVFVNSILMKNPETIVGESKRQAAVVIDNDQCDVKAYVAVTNDKVDDIRPGYKPTFGLSCTNSQTPQRMIPDIKTYWNASYDRPNARGIDPSWFVDSPDDRHKRHVLITLDMEDFYALDPSVYSCSLTFDLGFFGATVSGEITVNPIGCPDGFYGGHCNETCVCQNGGSCHPFNGACKCPDEWTGRACDIKSALHPHNLHRKRAAIYMYAGAAVGGVVLIAAVTIVVVYVIKRRARNIRYVSDALVDSEAFHDTPDVYTPADEYDPDGHVPGVPDVLINNNK